jgi:lipopolysaccharide transport system ATP-binding protein
VEQGSAVGIIGRNGAGKSTLLKILSQVTGPTTGSLKVKGRIASLLEVGTGFHPELSGRENVFLNGAILGMRKKEITRKFDEIVDFSGVERYIDTPVKRYSSGMYVRLAFAVAAHLESEILIVDEVLAVGDAEFQKKCLGKMGEVSKGEGRTVLFVSHNLASVKALCTQGIYLKDGLIDTTGSVSDVLNVYKRSSNRIFEMDTETSLGKRLNRCSANGRFAGFIRFSSLKILDADLNGKPSTIFTRKSTVLFEIDYEVFEEVVGLSVTLRFESTDTSEVVTSNVFKVSDSILRKGNKGKFVIKFIDLPFNPGEYVPYLVAHSPKGEAYDVVDKSIMNVPIIEIQNVDNDKMSFNEITAQLEIIK